MRIKVLVIFLFYFLCVSSLAGYSLPESSASGECVSAVTGKFTALGETAILGETWKNPALLTKEKGFKFDIGGGLVKSGERRKKGVFDSFDNRIGDVTVADNSTVFLEPAYFSISYTSNLNLGFGISVFPILSFDYRYLREVRDDFYVLKQTILDEGRGSLYCMNMGIAYEPFEEKISLGFGFNLYKGKREWEYREEYVDPSQTDANEGFSRTLSGNGVIFGIHSRPLTRVKLGGFVSMRTTYGDYSEDNIPLRIGGGFAIVPPNYLPALFIMDAVFERWSEVSDIYEDAIKLHLGVEHKLSSELCGRFGFGYETSYLSKNIPRAFFTFGFGFDKNGYSFDTGFEICKFSYVGDDIGIEQRDMEGIEGVEESLVKLIFSISYRL